MQSDRIDILRSVLSAAERTDGDWLLEEHPGRRAEDAYVDVTNSGEAGKTLVDTLNRG